MKDFYIIDGVKSEVQEFLGENGFSEMQEVGQGEDYLAIVNQNDKHYWFIKKRHLNDSRFMIKKMHEATYLEVSLDGYKYLYTSNIEVNEEPINPE